MLEWFARILVVPLEAAVAALPTAGTFEAGPATAFAQVLGAFDAVTGIGGPLSFLLGVLSAAPALIAVRCTTWAYRLVPGKFT